MKRIFIIALCALFAVAGCTKPEKGSDSKMPLPKNKAYHASFTLNDTKFDRPIKKGDIPKTIELTSGGKFLLGFLDTDAIEPEKAPLAYKSGIYKVLESKAISAGLIFEFPKYGTLTVKEGSGNNWTLEYTTAEGEAYEGAALLSGDVVTGELAESICRSWKPRDFIVSASGGNIKNAIVGKKFSADLYEIINYLRDNGVNINAADYEKYSLESIDYTENGMLFINFKDFAIAPFVGDFSLDESKDDNLHYDFSLSWEDNPVIPVTGVGSVTVIDSQMTLYTESDAVVSGKTYHISVSILCDEIK